MVRDIVIIGAGPAGISMAVESRTAGVSAERVLVVERAHEHSFAIRKYYPETKVVTANYKGFEAVCTGTLCLADSTKAETLSYLDRAIRDFDVRVRIQRDRLEDPSGPTGPRVHDLHRQGRVRDAGRGGGHRDTGQAQQADLSAARLPQGSPPLRDRLHRGAERAGTRRGRGRLGLRVRPAPRPHGERRHLELSPQGVLTDEPHQQRRPARPRREGPGPAAPRLGHRLRRKFRRQARGLASPTASPRSSTTSSTPWAAARPTIS